MIDDLVLVIPARYDSKRLPGKPLIDLCGEPMLYRTYKQCLKVLPSELIWVATDDERILNFCNKNSIQSKLTSSECLTGTDRVAEFARDRAESIFINVQGDEPLFNPKDLRLLIDEAKNSTFEVLAGYCEIKNEDEFRSLTIPKVVLSNSEQLMYMSRCPIPGNKNNEYHFGFRQVCAYSFSKNSLDKFISIKQKTRFEKEEDIELLRFLELDLAVRMVKMSNESIAVDVYDDLVKVRNAIKIKSQ
jgi:3-deoxy-manno-octulosonate cytidylyltransferase (CMP-KDO synthetase)